MGVKGYGAFMQLDADAVDLVEHPGWIDVDWSYADLKPGDCIYIPFQWYHQVTAPASRSVNAHIWYWRPKQFDERSCEGDIPNRTFADCTWGFEPDRGHLGYVG